MNSQAYIISVEKYSANKHPINTMPRSVYVLFVSKYPNSHGLSVGDTIVARIKHFNYEQKRFIIVDIEETIEDREVVYVYYGQVLGNP